MRISLCRPYDVISYNASHYNFFNHYVLNHTDLNQVFNLYFDRRAEKFKMFQQNYFFKHNQFQSTLQLNLFKTY